MKPTSSRRLSGKERADFHAALLDAFPTRGDVERLVSFQLSESLDAIARPAPLSDEVFALIRWTEAEGRISELVAQAASVRPGNVSLQTFRAYFERATQDAQPPGISGPSA